ncbi:lipoyl synthase [Klebsiella pneumoniae]
MSKPIVMERGVKYRDADKMALIPVKNVATEREALLRKPEWMKIKLPADSSRIQGIKAAMRKNGLHSVCEEASCPNLAECFNHGTATFMILGAICTRRCPFCDVAHGRPVAPDANEPQKLAQTIADMGLRYVVVTSVDRDDLRDGGAQHFADCISAIREKNPSIKIETLVPISERAPRQPCPPIYPDAGPDFPRLQRAGDQRLLSAPSSSALLGMPLALLQAEVLATCWWRLLIIPVILMYTAWSYYVFRGKVSGSEGYH